MTQTNERIPAREAIIFLIGFVPDWVGSCATEKTECNLVGEDAAFCWCGQHDEESVLDIEIVK